ncbi:outer membrane lipoprotein carrier protein LolA [Ahniella affigens]|uniref:Outer-membrane lipoprotein carrier protein n=1 Tax=Ahniella affigens TaxID=2021234 RepID=A0A2P1PLP9_9GAMM|nr:outer membrane lipoprotein chaperone LolA [Ahniella affigens]AVP95752.1 outer membrane lipoprotein carrier protein LolA [Ahniella affigens]
MRLSIGSSLVLVLGVLAGSAHAGPARDRLEQFAKGLVTVRATFQQDSLDPKGQLIDSSTGKLALHAPRQFRWEYEAPFSQLIVADGLNVWIYDPDLEQVTVRAQSLEEAQSPLTVLTDLAQLDRDFVVGESNADGVPTLVLKAKAKDPAFKEVQIRFGESSPSEMLMVDLLGTETVWRFDGWERNPKIADAEFAFTPEDGIEIVGEPLRAPSATPLAD